MYRYTNRLKSVDATVVEQRGNRLAYRRAIGAASAVAALSMAACSGEQPSPRSNERAPTTTYSVKSGDVTLNVATLGNPDAKSVTIAVHGGPGLSLESLSDLEQLAGEDRLLVRYDQRGAGYSTAPSDGDYGLQSQIDDIEAVRQSTGAETVDLIGRSWGGMLATAYAAQYPESVDDLVLISSIPLDTSEYLAGQKRFSARVADLQSRGIIPNQLPEIGAESCEDRIDALIPAYMADPNGEAPDGVGSCTTEASQLTYQAITQPGAVEPYADLARRYDGDVLVVAGDKDPFGTEWPKAITAMLARGAVRQVIYKDTGHFVTFERPKESLQLIDEFID